MAAVATRQTPRGYIERPRPSGLADVIEVILDKGLVIDAYVRVSLIGIEILTVDARIVVASVDTYLRFAEAVNRLDLMESGGGQGLPEMIEGMSESGASSKTKGLVQGAKDALFGDEDEDEDKSGDEDSKREKEPARRTRSKTSETKRRKRSTSGS